MVTHSPSETQAYGTQLASALRGGEVFALCGELGAGKTHLAKGIAAALGCDPAAVTSPTFTLVHEYSGGRLPLYHLDFYRLESTDEVWRLGFEDYLAEGGVILVEWGNKFPEVLPAHSRWFDLRCGAGEERHITERP